MMGDPMRLARNPFARLGILAALLAVSVGAARSLYVDPRVRETRALETEEARLRGELEDLGQGYAAMEQWAREHPGAPVTEVAARRARPAEHAVAAFLDALGGIAERHDVKTDRIEPVGAPETRTAVDASGQAVAFRVADLRFHWSAGYRELADCLREIEGLDQLVVIRSVAVRLAPESYPKLDLDVVVRVYGTV